MANQQHLAILKQGVEVWNQWRQEYADVQPDLSETKLMGIDLSRANLKGAKLSRIDLGGANLKGANLSSVHLNSSHLGEANLDGAILREANLLGTSLVFAHLEGADLSNTILLGADLRGAILWEADLKGANLFRADLAEAYLRGANLSKADLSYVTFRVTDLTGADLREAEVGGTTFGNLDLRTVKGLDTTKHKGPSTIGIDTIIRSHGNIPEIFLRNAGVPNSIIEAIPSLIGSLEPIQYYTCFISYSSKDQDFAERLYANLQSRGVGCWFAPENMKIGDRMRDRIDQSIHLYDKLLLILSEQSVMSEWVEDEVEAAMERERLARERGEEQLVLFPVRLDEAVKTTTKAWAAKLRRQRHIGDFTLWKDHEIYQQAFERLLRDLKAGVVS